jgi:Ca-activated chloride channel homolog
MRRMFKRTIGVGVVLGALALVSVQAQNVTIRPRPGKQAAADTAPSAILRADSNLVLVPVTVTDKLGRPVTGLEKENFRVLDDKVEQQITQLANDDEPVAVGFIFDISGSIGGLMPQYRRAAHEFFQSADDADEFFLVEFQSSARLVVPLTRNVGEIDYQILLTQSKGSTALFDAVYMGANEMRKSKLTKKALILVSDGGENNSRYTYTEVRNALRETDALLYSIGPSPDDRFGDNDGGLMKQLAEVTGGRLIEMHDSDFGDLARKVIIDLRNRYVIGYAPSDKTRDGRYHHIEVQVIPPKGLPKLKAHWRTGYYAPDH